jgi:hypothetical protein
VSIVEVTDDGDASGTRPRRSGPPPPVVILFGILLLAPLALWSTFAQDAVPFVVAGELARASPDDVYTTSGDVFVPPPRFAERSCVISPPGTDCENEVVSFVSPPSAIPLAVLVAEAGARVGPFLLRVIAAGSTVAGLWLLRRRLLEQDPAAEGPFLVTALLLLPMIMVPLALGQTSTLMFLSAAIGLRVADRSPRHAVLVGVLWGATIAIKLSPLFLLPVLLWRRRWIVAGTGLALAAVAGLAALAIGGTELVDGFTGSLDRLEAVAGDNPYSGSIEAAVHWVAPDLATSTASAVAWGTRLVVLAALLVVGRRIVDEDLQWAWAWTACLLFVPMVWWHYVWVAIAALALLVLTRPREERPASLLVVAALATVPMSLVNGSERSLPVAQFAYLLAAVAIVTVLAPKGEPAGRWRPPPAVTPDPPEGASGRLGQRR